MRFSTTQRLALGLVLVVSAGCSDATAIEDRDQVSVQATEDLAASAGESIALNLGIFMSAETDALGLAGAAPEMAFQGRIPPGCTRQTDGSYTCTASRHGNVDFTRSYTFFDASGAIQEGYDALTTASIHFLTTMSGSGSRDGHTFQFSNEHDMTLSGLAGTETERLWNGTGSGARTETWTGERGTRTYSVESSDTTNAVRFLLPRSENPYPASGSIIHRMAATSTFDGINGSGTRSFQRRTVVTFNGTSIAALTINDRECTLDLSTRRVSCAH